MARPIGTTFGTHNYADPPGNGYTPNKLPLETRGGTWGGGFRGQHSKVWESCQTAGPMAPTVVHVCGFIWEWT